MTSMNAQERNTAPFTDGTLELKHQNHDTAMYLDENCGDELTDLELEEISGGFFWGFEARPIIDGSKRLGKR